MASPKRSIATMNEGPLHAALKAWYARPGDRTEAPVDGRQIDLVRGDLLIEIQTRGFSALRDKLEQLLEGHRVRIVHPVAARKWIVRVDDRGAIVGRRKSPREGQLADVFTELVSLSPFLAHSRFSIEVLLTEEEEVRRHEPGRAWRRKGWVTFERRLVSVVERRLIGNPRELLRLVPTDLPSPFTTADLARHMRVARFLAQKVAYCLRSAGVIHLVGKQGHALAYRAAA